MNIRPLVSIVIPCFNYGEYLPDAITSAYLQTYPEIEVLVVDDGSTDNTFEVARSFGSKLRYHYQANRGLPSARNAGLAQCNGSYFVFLDADDMLAKTYVERLYEVFRDNNHPKLGFVYTQKQIFGLTCEITDFPEFSIAELTKWNYIHASAMISAQVFQEVRYDETLRDGGEDWDLYLSIVERGYHGRLVDEPLLHNRHHNSPARMFAEIDEPEAQAKLRADLRARHPKLLGIKST